MGFLFGWLNDEDEKNEQQPIPQPLPQEPEILIMAEKLIIDVPNLGEYKSYKIQPGDVLSKIAKTHRTTVEALRTINNLKNNNIISGKTLRIPEFSNDKDLALKSMLKYANGKQLVHVVKSGDSLWSISKRYQVSIKHIARINNLATKTIIKPGQKLVILLS